MGVTALRPWGDPPHSTIRPAFPHDEPYQDGPSSAARGRRRMPSPVITEPRSGSFARILQRADRDEHRGALRTRRHGRRAARLVRHESFAVPRSRTPYSVRFDPPRSQHHWPWCVLLRGAQCDIRVSGCAGNTAGPSRVLLPWISEPAPPPVLSLLMTSEPRRGLLPPDDAGYPPPVLALLLPLPAEARLRRDFRTLRVPRSTRIVRLDSRMPDGAAGAVRIRSPRHVLNLVHPASRRTRPSPSPHPQSPLHKILKPNHAERFGDSQKRQLHRERRRSLAL